MLFPSLDHHYPNPFRFFFKAKDTVTFSKLHWQQYMQSYSKQSKEDQFSDPPRSHPLFSSLSILSENMPRDPSISDPNIASIIYSMEMSYALNGVT